MLAWCLHFIGTATVSMSKSSTALPIPTLVFGNGNIISEARPISKLNTSALKSTLTVLKTFCCQINLQQAITTAIMVIPGSVTAYTVSLWNNTQASGQRKDERTSHVDGASRPIFNTTSTPEQRNGGKLDPTNTCYKQGQSLWPSEAKEALSWSKG
jgi:hypothetical protein